MADADTAKDVETSAQSGASGGTSGGSFIFGQNMEDRAVKKPEVRKEEEKKKENGSTNEMSAEAKSPPPGLAAATAPRSAVFKPLTHLTQHPMSMTSHMGGYGTGAAAMPPIPFAGNVSNILAPGKLSHNPFATKMPHHHLLSGTPNTSDSEEERKYKSIISPAHFKPSHKRQDVHNNASPPSIILRPSALSAQTQHLGKGMKTGFEMDKADKVGSSFLLKPATLQSPFTKSLDDICHKNRESEVTEKDSSSQKSESDIKDTSQSTCDSNSTSEQSKKDEESARSDAAADSAKENFALAGATSLPVSSPESHDKAKFVFGQKMEERAVNVENTTESSSSASVNSNDSGVQSSSSASSFVFGQNLSDRVIGSNDEKSSASNDTGVNNSSSSLFIFGQNLSDRVTGPTEEKSEDGDKTSSLTLAESAKEYQAKHAQKEYDEVVVKTGEEDESNVLQANCKLYMFDTTTENWVEKGRGLFRLNDKNESNLLQSRIVMRTQGSLKVILNTKIWCGMMIEQASTKSLRITAQCDDVVRVFLIMANPKDTDHIFSAIDWRIQQLKIHEESQAQKEQKDDIPSTVAEKRPAEENEEESSPTTKRPRTENRDTCDPDPRKRREVLHDESNDSSAVDPETEVSYESSSSSPTVKSLSSSE